MANTSRLETYQQYEDAFEELYRRSPMPAEVESRPSQIPSERQNPFLVPRAPKVKAIFDMMKWKNSSVASSEANASIVSETTSVGEADSSSYSFSELRLRKDKENQTPEEKKDSGNISQVFQQPVSQQATVAANGDGQNPAGDSGVDQETLQLVSKLVNRLRSNDLVSDDEEAWDITDSAHTIAPLLGKRGVTSSAHTVVQPPGRRVVTDSAHTTAPPPGRSDVADSAHTVVQPAGRRVAPNSAHTVGSLSLGNQFEIEADVIGAGKQAASSRQSQRLRGNSCNNMETSISECENEGSTDDHVDMDTVQDKAKKQNQAEKQKHVHGSHLKIRRRRGVPIIEDSNESSEMEQAPKSSAATKSTKAKSLAETEEGSGDSSGERSQRSRPTRRSEKAKSLAETEEGSGDSSAERSQRNRPTRRSEKAKSLAETEEGSGDSSAERSQRNRPTRRSEKAKSLAETEEGSGDSSAERSQRNRPTRRSEKAKSLAETEEGSGDSSAERSQRNRPTRRSEKAKSLAETEEDSGDSSAERSQRNRPTRRSEKANSLPTLTEACRDGTKTLREAKKKAAAQSGKKKSHGNIKIGDVEDDVIPRRTGKAADDGEDLYSLDANSAGFDEDVEADILTHPPRRLRRAQGCGQASEMRGVSTAAQGRAKASQGNTRTKGKGQAGEESKGKMIRLSSWFLRPVQSMRSVRIEGKLPNTDYFWATSVIVDRVSNRVLRSTNGSLYQPLGPISQVNTRAAGFSAEVAREFRNGFPPNWKKLIESELDASHNSSPGSSPRPVKEKAVPKEKQGAKCKSGSQGGKTAVTANRTPVHRKKMKDDADTLCTPIQPKTGAQNRPSSEHVWTPQGVVSRALGENAVRRTQSGRRVIPPLARWAGQYRELDDDGNVSIRFASQAAELHFAQVASLELNAKAKMSNSFMSARNRTWLPKPPKAEASKKTQPSKAKRSKDSGSAVETSKASEKESGSVYEANKAMPAKGLGLGVITDCTVVIRDINVDDMAKEIMSVVQKSKERRMTSIKKRSTCYSKGRKGQGGDKKLSVSFDYSEDDFEEPRRNCGRKESARPEACAVRREGCEARGLPGGRVEGDREEPASSSRGRHRELSSDAESCDTDSDLRGRRSRAVKARAVKSKSSKNTSYSDSDSFVSDSSDDVRPKRSCSMVNREKNGCFVKKHRQKSDSSDEWKPKKRKVSRNSKESTKAKVKARSKVKEALSASAPLDGSDHQLWSAEEIERLKKATAAINSAAAGYWQCVSEAVGTRSAEECAAFCLRDKPDRTKGSTKGQPSAIDQSSTKGQSSAKATVTETPSLHGKKGSLKRRRELRALLEHEGTASSEQDDLFHATPFRTRKKAKVPCVDFSKSDREVFGDNPDFFTPKRVKGLDGCGPISHTPASGRKTPALRSAYTNPWDTDTGPARDVDLYMFRLEKTKRQLNKSRGKKKSQAGDEDDTAVSPPSQRLFHPDPSPSSLFKITEEQSVEDEEETDDYYYSDDQGQ